MRVSDSRRLNESRPVAGISHQTARTYVVARQPQAPEDAYRKSLAISVPWGGKGRKPLFGVPPGAAGRSDPCGGSPWGHRAYRSTLPIGMETALSMGCGELT
jgi:hypothetical protein